MLYLIFRALSINHIIKYYCTPDVKTKIIELFCTSYYSSSLWDLFSKNCDKLFKSFNVSIRIINNIDRKTHRYFIEHLINTDHPQVMCSSRLVNFYNTLLTCRKPSVRNARISHDLDCKIRGHSFSIVDVVHKLIDKIWHSNMYSLKNED